MLCPYPKWMKQIELGSSGVKVSSLGIGTWAWGDNLYWGYGKGYGENDLQLAFDETLRAGIDFFDTAEIYGFGKSEKFIGEFLRIAAQRDGASIRDNVHIATKFACLPYRVTKSSLLRALRGSLKRLGVSQVDLYQIHWNFAAMSIETMMDAMAEAVEKKLTRAVGVSNYNVEQVRRAHKRLAAHNIPLASNQIEYNLLQRGAEFNGMVETCRELNVTIIAYSPMRFGVLTGKYSPTNPLPGARGRQFSVAYLAQIEPFMAELKKVAQKYDKSIPQVAINWVMQRGAIPIPGAKNLKQAQENAGALGWNLAREDVEFLNEMSTRVHAAR